MAQRYLKWVPSVPLMKRIGRLQTAVYRGSGGRVWARNDGLDMLLLTTTGRRSGLPRTQPLPYFRCPAAGDDLVVIASFGGGPRDPDWLHNLRAKPEVEVQLKRERFAARASEADADDRQAIWEQVVAEHPRYLDYQAKTARTIPVVRIAREPC